MQRRYSRFRSRGNVPGFGTVSEKTTPMYNGVQGASYDSFADVHPGNGSYDVMSDFVDRDFHRKKAAGDVIFNPMEQVSRSQTGKGEGYLIEQLSPGSYAGTSYQADGNWAAYLGIRAAVPLQKGGTEWKPKVIADSAPALQRMIAVASTQAQRLPSDAQLLVAAAEWRKTLELVPGLLKGWSDLFRRINEREKSFSRKRFASRPTDALRNMRDLEHVLTDTWLALRFGARPLVHDTLGTLKALKRKRTGDVVRETQRGIANWYKTESTSLEASFGILKTPLTVLTQDRFTVRAMSIWEAKIATMDDLGVSPWHVPEAVIDLVRFSFVLNWIVNLNDYFSALGASASPTWSNRGGVYVIRRETSTLVTIGAGSYLTMPSAYRLVKPCKGWAMTSTRETRRVVGLTPPSLSIRPRPFGWTEDARLLDAIALLRQQTRGRGVGILARLDRTLYGANGKTKRA